MAASSAAVATVACRRSIPSSPRRTRRERADGVDVTGPLLVAKRAIPAAGRAECGEHVSALGGRAQGAPDEGAEHAVESVGGADLGGQLAMQMLCLTLIDGGEQFAPVREVLVDERPAHAGVLRHRVHRDRRDVARRDERDGGVEEGVAPLGAGQAGGFERFGADRLDAPCAPFHHGDIVSPHR